jgi:hypothetical protein
MGKCYECGTEFTLKQEETICDTCKKTVNYPCNNCKQWFSIADDNGKKIEECKTCGFFVCPNCNDCGPNCAKIEWYSIIKGILSTNLTEDIKIRKICNYIEEIKSGKEQKLCPRKVPISYAKGRIKMCLARMEGYNIKNSIDKEKFKERLDKIFAEQIGYTFTITDKRENGNYGQEYRDAVNAAICYGKIKAHWMQRENGDKYLLYERTNGNACPLLNANDILIKRCRKCKKYFPTYQNFCNTCKKKGEPIELILKVNNKDICQLARSAFKRRGDKNGEQGN